MTARTDWLLYGANGYTGKLIAEAAAARGVRPILAGRREDAVRPIAEGLGLPWRCFPLDSPAAITPHIADCAALLLCAGPFSATSGPVVEACLRAGTHYLDITGEMVVFEACFARSDEAKQAGVVLMPGVGFDVVPSDCLAASLKAALPDATRLELAIGGTTGASVGTTKTMLENFGRGAVREGGRVRVVPVAHRGMDVPFRDHTRYAVTIPWGDLVTAYYSTGIGDISVYMAMARPMAAALRLLRRFEIVVRHSKVQRLLQRNIERYVSGPSEETRRTARWQLWGRVSDGAGTSRSATLEVPEGYALTVATALESTLRVAAGKVPPGTQTPSLAFGAGYITEFPGCDLRIEP